MITLDRKAFEKAIERSKAKRNRVEIVAWRLYDVVTPEGRRYRVRFTVENGVRKAGCNCAAKGPCHHIPAAYFQHTLIGRQKYEAGQ